MTERGDRPAPDRAQRGHAVGWPASDLALVPIAIDARRPFIAQALAAHGGERSRVAREGTEA